MQFLEANLVRQALAAKRMPLDNGNAPAEPTLSEADRADMQVFLDNMLGVQAFEQAPPAATAAAPLLSCSAARARACSPRALRPARASW